MKKLRLDELNRLDVDAYKKADKLPIVAVLDSIRSAMNVGSFFRTADALGIGQLVLCGFSATPPHKEITKTAIGATESVDWRQFDEITEAIDTLIEEGYKIIVIEQTSESIALEKFEVEPDTKYAIVFGNEVDGVSDEVLPKTDYAIEIPQYGTKHSLNVSVCGGIVLHHLSLKIRKN